MIKHLLLLFLFIPVLVFAQLPELHTKSDKAKKQYQKAMEYLDAAKNELGANELRKAIETDPNFIEAHIVLAGVFQDTKKHESAIAEYKAAIAIDPNFFPNNYYNLAESEVAVQAFADAKEHLKKLLSFAKISPDIKKRGEHLLANAEFAEKAVKNPVPFEPKNLGPNVNTRFEEYLPTLTADEQTLIVTVKMPDDTIRNDWNNASEDFYQSKKVDGVWQKRSNVGPPINTPANEGAQCISPDGQFLFYTLCNSPGGMGRCDIYFSMKEGKKWSTPKNVGPPINSKFWDSQPSLSSDGNTLYFVSNRPGGKGEKDIWSSTLTKEGYWGTPVNLGDSINTTESDMSPYIHPDNQTLYFASAGHPGMGKHDIFYARMKKDGTFGKPTNIGYPINTAGDEFSLIVNSKGNLAYYASADRKEGFGNLDLYTFELYEKARPTLVTYVKGKVFDSESKKMLDAKLELMDLETSKVVAEIYSNAITGEYLVCLPANKNYAFNASRSGYLFYSENFSLKDVKNQGEPYLIDIPLKPIKAGEKVVLRNIFFETGKYNLKDESRSELNKLGDFLNANPKVKIEVSGHTDNVGDEKMNTTLSLNRAKSVYDYLIKNGIAAERLTFKGFGETQPVASNDSDKGRAANRRTEFKVITID
jgi:outer membrane protein OmpA-like peptidoglycan-associated protein/tetratricopeptide (TPR) repeat protein